MAAMAIETRKTGIDVVGDMPWGTHFCLFYETKEDLLDILIPYCKAGLESEESFQWAVADPLTIEEAKDALKGAVPDLDRYLADSSIEMMPACDCYLHGGAFDLERVAGAWLKKLARASARGYAGVRVTGDTAWLEKKDWKDFYEYEKRLNDIVANQRLAVLCTYPLAACGADEVMDVVSTHQFAVVKRHGSWDVIETAGHKQAKAEIKRLNDELEQRVVERTSQLMQASEALREAQTELAHVNRVTTMGQLAASIAHEISQPLTAAVANASAGLRWLAAEPPNLAEAGDAFHRVVKAGNQAGDVIGRIRALIKKAPPRTDELEINDVVREVIALTQGEVAKNGVSLQTALAADLPLVQGDRVQLQQVILNLIINAVEAMNAVGEGSRALLIGTGIDDASNGVMVAVQDSGPGLNPQNLDRLFDAFYTTKPDGMGMGLSICRSIVGAHGGRVWASRRPGPGLTVQFSVPVGDGLQPEATRAGRSSAVDSGVISENQTASAS
jgi:signal transduction histidine kinase